MNTTSWMTVVSQFRRRFVAGLGSAADLLYPPACPWCLREPGSSGAASPHAGLCDGCRAALVPAGGEWCPRCAAPAGPYAANETGCRHCQNEGYRFRSAVTLGNYGGDLQSAVLVGKAPLGERLIRSLTDALWEARKSWFRATAFDVVFPVPHHWMRRLSPGHLASETIAHRLAGWMKTPCWHDAVAKTRWTRPQRELSATERRTSQRKAFAATGRPVAGRRVLLVDDVMTTGGTVQAVARVLLDAGAAEVHVAVLARSVRS